MEQDLNRVGGHCPRCGQEYRPGFAECADCRVPLHRGPAPAGGEWAEPGPPEEGWRAPGPEPSVEASASPPQGAPEGPLVRLGSYPRREAILVSGLLESADIFVTVYPDPLFGTSAYSEALDPLFGVFVPEPRLDEARALLEERAELRPERNGW
jgi:hypothetical protein